jgi:hypothetical protein
MSYPQIRLFNPLSLQVGADGQQHRHIQNIIWYAESRFRQALLLCSEARDPLQRSMQTALWEELVSRCHRLHVTVLSYARTIIEICIDNCWRGRGSRPCCGDPHINQVASTEFP